MLKQTKNDNQIKVIMNGNASELMIIIKGVIHDNTIRSLKFVVVKETVAKLISKERNKISSA